MSKTIYIFTRQIAAFFSFLTSFILLYQGYYLRSVGSMVLFILFICTSILYQKRFNIITTPYLFIFVNLYIVFSLVASYYDCSKIIELDETGFQNWGEKDYYPIYFVSVFFAYVWIIVYLKCCCKTKKIRVSDILITKSQINKTYIGICINVFAFFAFGRNDIIIIPGLALILILVVIDRNHRIINICLFIVSLIIFRSIYFSRYYVIQIVSPVVIAYLMSTKKNDNQYSIFRLYFYFAIGLSCVLLYGVISEMIKLNLFYGANYKLSDFFSSKDKLLSSCLKQIYRLFIIWIKDGGYIIYHVHKYGFYYGLSYIKSISGFLSLPYINLPQIAATYNYSTYSQTGLLAEGYANFGIIGAVLNLIIVFFVMEFMRKRFVYNPSLVTLSFVAVPFTKILFDGGSLGSFIALFILLLVIYCFSILKKKFFL